jgi:hypothetical protein
MTKRIFFCAMLVCATALVPAAQIRYGPAKMKTYELYSWPGVDGWEFGLFLAISSAGTSPGVITQPRNTLVGQQELKRAIADMPAHSEIRWLDHGLGGWPNAKEWERIKYPPPEVIADIRKFCQMKGHKLSVGQPKESKTK